MRVFRLRAYQVTCLAVPLLSLAACTVNEKSASDGQTAGQGGKSVESVSTGGSSKVNETVGRAGSGAGALATAAIAGQGSSGGTGNLVAAAGQSNTLTTPLGGSGGVGTGGANSLGTALSGAANTAGSVDSTGAMASGGASDNVSGAGRGSVNNGGASGGVTTSVNIAGRNSADGGTSSQGTSSTVSVIPSELVGVWQQTRATSGDYVSPNGSTFSLTSGFSVQLKLSSNGAYYLVNFGSGVGQTCTSVTNFEQSVGQAALVGNSLVFSPSAHVVDVSDCSGSKRVDLGTTPFALTISLEDTAYFYGGIRTYRMLANGGPHPYDLMLLHRPPLTNPPVPPQPADFVLGTDGPYDEFQGLWVAAAGTDSNFFDPSTGEFHFPELNGSPHAWLRMVPGGYETAIALQNVNTDGPCKSDVIYYEQGEARFAVLEDVGAQGNHFVGHAFFQSTAARLIVRIRECDENDGTVAYDLPPLPRYFRFIYFSPDAPPERILLPCDFALSEWQSILCEAFPKGFIRR